MTATTLRSVRPGTKRPPTRTRAVASSTSSRRFASAPEMNAVGPTTIWRGPTRKGIASAPNGLISRRASSRPAASSTANECAGGKSPLRRRGADPAHASLDDAVRRVRVHTRPCVPPLAVDLELGLLRVVAEQRELLEGWLEPDGAQRLRDRLDGALCIGGAGGANADLDAERLHEAHRPSLRWRAWSATSSP